MTHTTPGTTIRRSGQSEAPAGNARTYTLVILVEQHPGSLDRIVGLLRRRRANMQTLVVGRSESPAVMRITVVVDDSQVEVEQLIEQVRKIVDVQRVESIHEQRAFFRELAVVSVNNTPANKDALHELVHQFGARVLDTTSEALLLELTASEEQIDAFVGQLQPYGIREVARSGRVAVAQSASGHK